MHKTGAATVPNVVTFLLVNAAVGAVIGIALASALVYANVAGLRDLIGTSSDSLIPLMLILVGFATTFGGLYTATAVMLIEHAPAAEKPVRDDHPIS